MSKISIEGNSSGTGTLTIAAPNTNTNRTLNLPDAAGTFVVSGTTPSLNGVTFPASQVASADANTLDDYEEGTWTPGVTFGGNSAGVTYAGDNSGRYTKIGRSVTVIGYLALSNKGSSTGNAAITGLPFTVASGEPNYGGAAIGYVSSMTFADVPFARTAAGDTYLALSETTNAGVDTTITNSDFANNTILRFTCTYFV